MSAVLIRAALAASLLAALPAATTDAKAILAVPRQRIQTADFTITGRLVHVDAHGTRTSYGVSIKAHGFPGVLRELVDVTSPAPARARLLMEMRFNGESSIRIAHPGDPAAVLPFDKWNDGPLGPGFSYEDFLEPQDFWPTQVADAPIKFGARDCDVIQSTPGAANRTHYSEVKTWLDHTIGFPVYAEKTEKGSGAVKEFTYLGLRHNGGEWSASQVEEKTRGQAEQTLLIIDRGTAKANLSLKDFTPEQLAHF